MPSCAKFGLARLLMLPVLALPLIALPAVASPPEGQPLPDVRQLMREVVLHQQKLEKVRENYAYNSIQTIEDMDASGRVKKTQSEERNDFFVNGHLIERVAKKNGQPLSGRDEERERDRMAKLIEKAQKTPTGQFLEDQNASVSQLLDLMDLRNPRRELFRGRPTIVFDFIGRKDAKTHGLAEDASKKLQGTIWIDEADRQVAHLEVRFNQNFRILGGLFATIDKGSSLRFDQAPVDGGLWLPTGGEATMQARLMMLKSLRQHITERDFDFRQFHVQVQTEQAKEITPIPDATKSVDADPVK